MRLTGWHVDGYGHFRDRRWDDLPTGLTVFHGPNEAGKSTLLSFLESVLFGFRDGRTKLPAIPALDGGTHGGRVFLESTDGAWTVGRAKPGGLTITGPGGAGSDADLRRLLGGVDRDLFSSVFAFSLGELEELGGLADDAFRQRLFAAGSTGVGQSAHDALAVLDRRAAAQYRQKSASVLKDLWDELEALKDERRVARAALEQHPVLRAEAVAERAAVETAEARSGELRREDRRLERLERVWSVSSRRAGVVDRLEALGDDADVPAGAVDEVLTLEARIAEQQEALDEVEGRRALRRSALDAVVVDPGLVRVAPAVGVLQAEAAAHRDRLVRVADLRRDARDVARRLQEASVEIGPSWSRERVVAFDASVAVRDEVDTWATALAGAARAVEDARAELARRDEDVAVTAAAREALGDVPRVPLDVGPQEDVAPVDVDELDRQVSANDRLRAGLDELGERRRDAEAAEARLHDHESAAPAPDAPSMADGPGLALVVAGVVAIVIGLGLLAAGQPAGGAATAVLGIVVLTIARAVARRAADGVVRAQDVASRKAARAERGVVLRGRHEDAVRAFAEAQARVARDAAAAGSESETPSYDEVRERSRALTAVRERTVAAAAHAERVAAADRELARAEAARHEHAGVLAAAEASAGRLTDRWSRWRTDHGVEDVSSPATVVRVVEAVLRARALHAESDRLAERVRASETEVEAWSSRAEAVLRTAGYAGDSTADPGDVAARLGEQLLAAVERLHDDATRAVGTARDREAVTGELSDLDEDGAVLRGRLAVARERRSAILGAYEVVDREALQDAAVATAERRRLRTTVDELEDELREVAGAGVDADRLIVEAGVGAVEAWAARRAAVDEERRSVGEDRDRAVRALTLADRACEELEASADLARIAGRIEEVRAEAAEAAVAFRTTLGAQRLIRDTLADYVDDRQPQVLVDASAWFSRVTEGRYPRIRQGSSKQETLELEDASGRTIDPAALSRGTREQLYLCLRLALATGVAAGGTPLPLIMDDVLVNFSPDRAEAMADVLAEVAEAQQVLVFTCHPSTRDLLERVAGRRGADVRVEELHRGGALVGSVAAGR